MASEHTVSLLEAVRRGNAEAFGTIFDLYHVRIYAYLRSLVRDAALAEDLTQDTFLKAYKAILRADLPEDFNAWLYAIATNTALSALRRRRLVSWLPINNNREADAKSPVADPESVAGDRDAVRRAIDRLPKADAACLLLRFAQGLDYAELADVLGTSVPAAKMRLSRARAAFREAYLALGREVDT